MTAAIEKETRWGYFGNLTSKQEQKLELFMKHYESLYRDNQQHLKEMSQQKAEAKKDKEQQPEESTLGVETAYDFSKDQYLFPGLDEEKGTALDSNGTAEADKKHKELLRKVLCLRFLRARKFDVEKAKTHLNDCIKMRQKYGYHKLYEKDGTKVFFHPGAQVYGAFSGLYDKKGRPIAVGRINVMDSPKMERDPHITGMAAFLEVMSLRTNPECDGLNYILDLKTPPGKPYPKNPIGIIQEVINRTNVIFPEAAHRMYVVNASFTFRMLFRVAQLCLPKRIVGKIRVVSSDYEKELFKDIPRDCVFPYFGGTAEGPKTGEEIDTLIKNTNSDYSELSLEQVLKQ